MLDTPVLEDGLIVYWLPVSRVQYVLEVRSGVVIDSEPPTLWPIGQGALGLWRRAGYYGVHLGWVPDGDLAPHPAG